MAAQSTFKRFMTLGEWGKYPIPTADCISVGMLAALTEVWLQRVFPMAPVALHILLAMVIGVIATLWIRWVVSRNLGSKRFW